MVSLKNGSKAHKIRWKLFFLLSLSSIGDSLSQTLNLFAFEQIRATFVKYELPVGHPWLLAAWCLW